MEEVVTVKEGGLASAVGRIRRLLTEGAATWRLSHVSMGFILVLPIIIAAMGVISALLGKEAYKWFTGEDAFAETMQVVFYCSALVMGLFLVLRHYRARERIIALLYLGVCLGFIFLIGEEISWGQRFFHWVTPSTMIEINKQEETTLHNIYGVEYAFKWLQMLVGAYGTILPLAIAYWRFGDKWRKVIDATVPHFTLVPYFLPMFVWRLFRNTTEVPPQFRFVVAEYNEVIELILAIGFALFMAFQLRQTYTRKNKVD